MSVICSVLISGKAYVLNSYSSLYDNPALFTAYARTKYCVLGCKSLISKETTVSLVVRLLFSTTGAGCVFQHIPISEIGEPPSNSNAICALACVSHISEMDLRVIVGTVGCNVWNVLISSIIAEE